jgi:hypothetical protein
LGLGPADDFFVFFVLLLSSARLRSSISAGRGHFCCFCFFCFGLLLLAVTGGFKVNNKGYYFYVILNFFLSLNLFVPKNIKVISSLILF